MAILNIFLHSPDFFTFEAGQVIFQRGDNSDFMYGIMSGDVEIRVGEWILETIGPGSVFGEMALIDSEPRSATAVAKTECRVIQINAETFHDLIVKYPNFALDVMKLMSSRLRRQLDFKAQEKS